MSCLKLRTLLSVIATFAGFSNPSAVFGVSSYLVTVGPLVILVTFAV